MNNKSIVTKIFAKILVFMGIFFFLYFNISNLFILHAGASKDITDTFYAQPKDSIDVVFLGNCHTYSSFMPLKMWDDYGFTSFVFASAGQNMAAHYYYFLESIKEQHPDIVVLEVFSVNEQDTYISKETFQNETINAFHNIPLSFNKISYVMDYEEEPNKLNLLAGLYMYHQRWDYQGELPITYENDIDYNNFEFQKGFQLFWNIEPLENPNELFETIDTLKTEPFDEESEKYLRKLLDKAKEEDIEVILVSAPYTLQEIEMKRLNFVEEIAKEYSIPFFNFNKQKFIKELQLTNNDMIDPWHVNYRGALKLTDYVGEFINENYTLLNKKNNTDFQSWNHDVNTFFETVGVQKWTDLNLIP